ncbi:MAG: hypothetical protein KDE56_34195, partial [Anaerolineales bacterium]|nr:hypothetical protein [Anaerolineales bacterium]
MNTIKKTMGQTLKLAGLLLLLLLGGLRLASASALPTAQDDTILTAGNYHNCGLKADGSVVCW